MALRPWSPSLVPSSILSPAALPCAAARGVVATVVPPRGPASGPVWGPGVATTVVYAGQAALLAAPSAFHNVGPRNPSWSMAGGAVVWHGVVHLTGGGCHVAVGVVCVPPLVDGAHSSEAGPPQDVQKTEDVPVPTDRGLVGNGVVADGADLILSRVLVSVQWCGLGPLAAAGGGSRGGGGVLCRVLLQRHVALQREERESS